MSARLRTTAVFRQKRNQKVCALLVALAIVGGCQTKLPPTHWDVVQRSIGAVRADWAEAAETGAIPEGWLKSLGDPQMEAVVIEALRNNLGLRAAATRIDAAAGEAIRAGSLMLPLVTAGGNTSYTATDGNREPFRAGVSLNVAWEIDIWGRLRAIRSAADERFVSVQYDYEYARESLAAQTAKAWYFATETRQQLGLTRGIVAVYEELVRVVRAKVDQGQVTTQDLNLAQAGLAAAQERALFADYAHKRAVRSLEVLLGRYPSGEHAVAETFSVVLRPVPAGVPAEMLERRPDIIAAETDVRIAFHKVQAAQLARLPRLSLSASGGASTVNALEPTFFTIGANFLAPIFTGGSLEAEVKIQNADQERALANYGERALRAFKEVEDGLRNEGLLAQREQLLQSAVAEFESAWRIANTRYNAGRISVLDVLEMQARLNLSQSDLITIRHARVVQRIDLHLALGGSFEGPSTPAEVQPMASAVVPPLKPTFN